MGDGRTVIEKCPEDALTPREMRGHQRMKEKGTPVPEWLTVHLETCKPCKSAWDFLEKTDPIIRRQHAARQPQYAPLVIREVKLES
jgi:hypothetical protein